MRSVTEEERSEVLRKVGSNAITRAISREGIFVAGDPMTASWRKAEIWATKEAHNCNVSKEVLTVIVIEEVNKLVIEETARHS